MYYVHRAAIPLPPGRLGVSPPRRHGGLPYRSGGEICARAKIHKHLQICRDPCTLCTHLERLGKVQGSPSPAAANHLARFKVLAECARIFPFSAPRKRSAKEAGPARHRRGDEPPQPWRLPLGGSLASLSSGATCPPVAERRRLRGGLRRSELATAPPASIDELPTLPNPQAPADFPLCGLSFSLFCLQSLAAAC